MNEKFKLPRVEENEDLIKKIHYPEEWEEDLYKGFQLVFCPYEIEGLIITTKWRNEHFIKQNQGNITPKHYNPFQEDQLLETIRKIDAYNMKSILDFCNKYGLLTTRTISTFEHEEHIETFIYEVTLIKKCLEIYGNIKNNIKGEITLELEQEYEFDQATAGNLTYDYFSLAESFLIHTINHYTKNIYPQVKKDSKGDYIPHYSNSNLISAVYYHLNMLLIENKQLKKCKCCGDYFVPRRSSSAFCPPRTAGERSPCENKYNQMVYWARKKILSKEKTIEEIAKMKGRPEKEVRGWIEGYNSKDSKTTK